MRPFCVLALAVTLLAPAAAGLDATYEVPDGLPVPEHVYKGGFVVAMQFAADGTLVWAELDGAVRMLREGETKAENLYEVPAVRGPEWGVTGLALDPDFVENRRVYVAYTWGAEGVDPGTDEASGEMRVVRLDADGEALIYKVEATRSHNSGRLLEHDGLLFFSNGEHTVVGGSKEERERAQDPGHVAGKVLRMTFDGKPAPGNPHATDARFDPYVYSMGHRNPFGLAWDDVRDRLVLSDPGPECCEEINAVEPGGNYGWPVCRGPCDPAREGITDPLVYYPKVITPVGMAAVAGEYYVAGFNTKEVRRAYDTGAGWTDEVVAVNDAGILDVEASLDGKTLWLGTWNGLWAFPTPAPRSEPPAKEDPPADDPPVDAPPVDEPPAEDPPATGTSPANGTPKEALPPAVGKSTPLPGFAAVLAGLAAFALRRR